MGMRIENEFTDLVLTSHAGLAALAQLLKAARLPALFGPNLKSVPEAANFAANIALSVLGKTDFKAVSAYRDNQVSRQSLLL
jgi:hypothetical protein